MTLPLIGFRHASAEKEPMRILYSHRIQSRDGQSVHIEELISAFREAGHEVLVVGPSAYQQASFGGEGRLVPMIRRLLPGFLGELAELAYNIPAYLRLKRAWRQFRPDLVYERYNLHFLAGSWLARRHGALLYLEVNAPLADERSRFGGLKLTRLAHWVERFTWRSARRVLAVTNVLGEIVAAAGAEKSRIMVVPNGIVLSRFPQTGQERDDSRIVLGFVGFVRSWHGLDQVIAAMAAHRDELPIHFTIIGDGPARPELEQQAAALGIADRVRFTGLVEHGAIPAHVSAFDIALQPQVTPYASPLKIFDYMAAGRAIIAPDQPNIREILQDGQTALLVDPARPDAIWEAIRRLARDPALGAAARGELERKAYTWQANAARIARWTEEDRARRR